MTTICPLCRGAGSYYHGVNARFVVQCECSIASRRRTTLLAGGFPAEAADLTASAALEQSARDPKMADSYRGVAVQLAKPIVTAGFETLVLAYVERTPPLSLWHYFAAAHALVRPVKYVALSALVDAKFGRTPPPPVTTDAAVFLMLGRDTRHSYLAGEAEVFLSSRLQRRLPTVVGFVADAATIEGLYGRETLRLLSTRTVL